MFGFLSKIFDDHHKSLPGELLWFGWLVPIPAVIAVAAAFNPTESQMGAIISSVSIYSALLFGILIPAGEQARRLKDQLRDRKFDGSPADETEKASMVSHRDTAKAILSNVSYSIIISLLTVLLLTVSLCLMPSITDKPTILYKATLAASTYLFVHLLALLLVVVRTVYSSLLEESKDLPPVSEGVDVTIDHVQRRAAESAVVVPPVSSEPGVDHPSEHLESEERRQH